jgi:hypothetical protein
VRVHVLAGGGAKASDFANVNATIVAAAYAALGVDAFIFMDGKNDQFGSATPAALTTSFTTIRTVAKTGCPAADVMFAMQQESAAPNAPPVPQAPLTQAIRVFAQSNDAAFLDLQQTFGASTADYIYGSARPWMTADNIHPDTLTGGRAVLDTIYRALTAMV